MLKVSYKSCFCLNASEHHSKPKKYFYFFSKRPILEGYREKKLLNIGNWQLVKHQSENVYFHSTALTKKIQIFQTETSLANLQKWVDSKDPESFIKILFLRAEKTSVTKLMFLPNGAALINEFKFQKFNYEQIDKLYVRNIKFPSHSVIKTKTIFFA